MLNNQPQQCNICFQPFGPFFAVCILPITPIITLSGTATPIHVRMPGAKKIICLACRQSYSNIEPWTEPEAQPLTPPCPLSESADIEAQPLTPSYPLSEPANHITTDEPSNNSTPATYDNVSDSSICNT